MTSDLLWIVLLGPLALAVVGAIPDGPADRAPRAMVRAAQAGALLSVALALGAGGCVAAVGALQRRPRRRVCLWASISMRSAPRCSSWSP